MRQRTPMLRGMKWYGATWTMLTGLTSSASAMSRALRSRSSRRTTSSSVCARLTQTATTARWRIRVFLNRPQPEHACSSQKAGCEPAAGRGPAPHKLLDDFVFALQVRAAGADGVHERIGGRGGRRRRVRCGGAALGVEALYFGVLSAQEDSLL